MRILILGAPAFLGHALGIHARARGHDITYFNRGNSPDLPRTHTVRGDREDTTAMRDLAARGPWDAVIDTSGRTPRTVLDGARALADAAARYLFVSTVSVYRDWPVLPLTEDSPVLDAPADAGPDFGHQGPDGYPTLYGHQKAGSERAVREVFGEDRSVILRPGVLLGPREYIGRLPWWLHRVAKGGHVLAPGDPDRLIQPVDVRDLAAFAVDAAEAALTGVYNVTAPRGHATFGELLDACVRITRSQARLTWVGDEILQRHGVRPWTELPMWRPYEGTWNVDAARAHAAGLTCRPIEGTVDDTWHWLRSGGRPIPHQRAKAIGIDPDREYGILAALRDPAPHTA